MKEMANGETEGSMTAIKKEMKSIAKWHFKNNFYKKRVDKEYSKNSNRGQRD